MSVFTLRFLRGFEICHELSYFSVPPLFRGCQNEVQLHRTSCKSHRETDARLLVAQRDEQGRVAGPYAAVPQNVERCLPGFNWSPGCRHYVTRWITVLTEVYPIPQPFPGLEMGSGGTRPRLLCSETLIPLITDLCGNKSPQYHCNMGHAVL
jgi:hypothetical protein